MAFIFVNKKKLPRSPETECHPGRGEGEGRSGEGGEGGGEKSGGWGEKSGGGGGVK